MRPSHADRAALVTLVVFALLMAALVGKVYSLI
jgi:hypothetical protein